MAMGIEDGFIPSTVGTKERRQKQSYLMKKEDETVINGRIVLNLWRVLNKEINLTNYDLENVCFHILKRRIPKFDFDSITRWF